jgi:hypothetical protein
MGDAERKWWGAVVFEVSFSHIQKKTQRKAGFLWIQTSRKV